jgi:ERCC4-type nuclease
MLIVDSNEYSKLGNKIDIIFKDIDYEVRSLKVGDYLWDDLNICIERKTVMDYISSLQSGHLFSQLKDMQVYSERYLFISGDYQTYNKMCVLKKRPVKFTVDQRIGSLCSIAGHYGVRIIPFDNEKQLLKGVFILHDKVGKAGDIGAEIERTTHHKNPTIRNYLSLPGMGLKKAEKLAEIYPNFIDFYSDVKEHGIDNIRIEEGNENYPIPKSIVNKTTREVLK